MSNLAIIPTLDLPGSRRWRVCGKLAVSSLLRALWDGELRALRSAEPPLFPTGRRDLVEKVNPDFESRNRMLGWRWDTAADGNAAKAGTDGDLRRWKVARAAARELLLEELASLENAADYEWVLLMDADCVALRNLDHLLDRDDADILVTSRNAPDPGFLAVRGRAGRELASGWCKEREKRSADWENGHAAALSAALAAENWRTGVFETGEVVRATGPGVALTDLKNAAVIHFGGMAPKDKQPLAFAFHMMTVYGDEDGLFLDMLES